MFIKRPEPRFFMDLSESPPICLPTNLDRSNLIKTTRVGDTWQRFYDEKTGKTHYGGDYYAQAMFEKEQARSN